MFCKNCGKEIDDNATICPNCGVLVKEISVQQPVQQTNTVALVGFILSLFTALIGLIVSCVGLSRSKQMNGAGRGFAIAGIIIGAIEMIGTVLITIAIIAAGVSAVS